MRVIAGDTDATPTAAAPMVRAPPPSAERRVSRLLATCARKSWNRRRPPAGRSRRTRHRRWHHRRSCDDRKRLPLAEIGRIGHYQVGELPNSVQPLLSHTRRFRLVDDLYIFTNGIHGAHVEVDTETGFIRLLKHWVVEDCGRVINPQLADEQVRGGCVQGHWRCAVRALPLRRGRPAENGSMVDYLTPMAAEMPDIDVAQCRRHTSVSELGAKGVGESGTGAAPAVIMNAVNDALRPFGARVTSQPITPEVLLQRARQGLNARTRTPGVCPPRAAKALRKPVGRTHDIDNAGETFG